MGIAGAFGFLWAKGGGAGAYACPLGFIVKGLFVGRACVLYVVVGEDLTPGLMEKIRLDRHITDGWAA